MHKLYEIILEKLFSTIQKKDTDPEKVRKLNHRLTKSFKGSFMQFNYDLQCFDCSMGLVPCSERWTNLQELLPSVAASVH